MTVLQPTAPKELFEISVYMRRQCTSFFCEAIDERRVMAANEPMRQRVFGNVAGVRVTKGGSLYELISS